MTEKKAATCFGFLTIRCSESIGYFGGLLTVNMLGRPIEFHCSLPIKPSRAQTILYGATLDDFLVGEQISLALVSKVKLAPILLMTDIPAALTLRHVHNTPLTCLDVGDDEPDAAKHRGLNKPTGMLGLRHQFRVADFAAQTLAAYASDAPTIMAAWEQNKPQIHPVEPFSRIVEALIEANPAAKAA